MNRIQAILFCTVFSMAPAAYSDAEKDQHAHEHEHEEHGPTETIVVTGSPLTHDRDELAVPIDRVDRDELLRNLGSTLGESVDHVPGITSTGFAAGASRPVVRGQDAFRTEVLEDGLPTQDVSQESPDHAIPVNPLAAERVEIVRGPATLRYGGGASAGVVNTITNRVPDRLPNEPIKGDLYGGIGLLANERDFAATLDGKVSDFAWHADGVLRRANNYGIPNDGNPHTQTGSQYESYAGSLGGAYIADWGRFGASYSRVENTYGIPEDEEPVEIDMHTDRYRFEGDLEGPFDGIQAIRVRGVYSDYEHKEIAAGVVGQTYRNEQFDGRVELIHEELAGFRGAVGIQGRSRDFRAEGEAADFLAPTDSQMEAIYFVEERDLPGDLSLELGFRFEHTRIQGQDASGRHRERNFLPLSGAIGLVTEPIDGLIFGLHGSASQRAPSQVELLARGPHEATSTFELGDASLDPEKSYTAEFRVESKGERGRIEAAAFYTQYDDFIFGEVTGGFVDEMGAPVAPTTPDALTALRYRSRDAAFYGAEVSGDLDLWETALGTFVLDGRFDIVEARFLRGDNSRLPRIVPIRFGAGVGFQGDIFDARVGFLRTEAQEDVARFERATASYTHLNASIAFRFDLIDGAVPLELTVVARNLTDVRGRNHVSFNKESALLPGRNIRFGLRAQF